MVRILCRHTRRNFDHKRSPDPNGAVTHFFDMNTRFVPSTFQQTAGGLTITAPANANHAAPGYYMLFMVNSNGVPVCCLHYSQ
jgi:hypothetical protein